MNNPNDTKPAAKKVWTTPQLTTSGSDTGDIALFSGMNTDGPYASTNAS